MTDDLLAKLRGRLPVEAVRWMVKTSGFSQRGPEPKLWVRVVPYLKSDTLRDHLDDIFGPMGWSSELHELVENNRIAGFKCRLAVLAGAAWIVREDVAQISQQEPLKGAASGAFKRAAHTLGIARYLDACPEFFADVSTGETKLPFFGTHTDKDTKQKTHYTWNVPAKAIAWLDGTPLRDTPQRTLRTAAGSTTPPPAPPLKEPDVPPQPDVDFGAAVTPMPGKQGSWGGTAGRPIGRVHDTHLAEALAFYEQHGEDAGANGRTAREALATIRAELTRRATLAMNVAGGKR